MHADVVCCLYMLSKMGKRKKEKERKRKKTTPFGINSTRSQVLYQAAQIINNTCWAKCNVCLPVQASSLCCWIRSTGCTPSLPISPPSSSMMGACNQVSHLRFHRAAKAISVKPSLKLVRQKLCLRIFKFVWIFLVERSTYLVLLTKWLICSPSSSCIYSSINAPPLHVFLYLLVFLFLC